MVGVMSASMRECMTSYCTEVSRMIGSMKYWVRRMYRSMMLAMREGMSTEVWEMVGSMGYKMDYKEV
jgi:hypothetical protein